MNAWTISPGVRRGARRNGKDVALQKPGKQLSARNSFPGSVEGQSSRRLAIDGFGHHETPAIVRVSQPAFGVLNAGLTAHRDKQGTLIGLNPVRVPNAKLMNAALSPRTAAPLSRASR